MRAVNGRCEVYMDGGVRNGTDIFKALALGAKAVFIGRPVVFALACNVSNHIYLVHLHEVQFNNIQIKPDALIQKHCNTTSIIYSVNHILELVNISLKYILPMHFIYLLC